MTHPSDLSARITAAICEHQLFRAGDTLIIGLSGGADSTALLDLLANLPKTPLHLIAAHLNHCLRGPESDADEDFCRALANHYKIPFVARRVDVQSLADSQSLNLEDAGRQARIAFFDELLSSWKATAVVLAHHADDQAETVLMRLLRGSGLTGLAGIPYRNGRGYIRPLLGFTRSEIEAHLTERGQEWREDSTNLDTSLLRNRIRHELLPLLEQYNPAIRTGLATTAAILAAENDLLDKQATHATEQICQTTHDGIVCTISSLLALPLALQRRVVRLAIAQVQGSLEQLSYQHVDAICRMATVISPHSRINLPHGLVAIREYDTLLFRSGEAIQPEHVDLCIPGPGLYQLPDGATLMVALSPAPGQFGARCASSAYLDLAKVPFPWHVRTYRPGDRMQPLGMSGRKKLKDLFIDDKVPRSQRYRLPLVFCRDELIWVCGLRTSQVARLDDSSSQIAKVVFSRSG